MKKWLALLLMLTMVFSLCGCGTSEPAPTEAKKVEVPPTEYLPYEGETLTVLYMAGDHAEAARTMAPEFEAVTGAKVEVVELSYEEMHEVILLDLVSYIGAYDVINIDSQWDGEFSAYLEPLDSYIARDKYDMGVWIENVLANCGQWQDKIVGIPTSCSAHVFAYRTDLLPNGIPANWNEYRRVVGMLNKPATGMYGIAVSKTPDQLVDMFNRILWSMGGKWADEDWKVTIISNEGRNAINYMNGVKSFSDPACLEWTTEEAIQAFLDGNAAVCESGTATDILRMANDPSMSQIVGNWAFGRIPYDKTGITTLSAWDAAIPVGAQDKDLAWEWIKMFTDSEMQNRFYEEFDLLSPRKDFWEQEKLEPLRPVRDALDAANTPWRISAFLSAEETISSTLSDFLSGKTYQDTAMRKIESELKTLLENIPPEEGVKNYNH